MTEFKLTFCPQCAAGLAAVPAPPIVVAPGMYCRACRLIFAAVRHSDDLLALFIGPLKTTEDGSIVPAGVAVEVGVKVSSARDFGAFGPVATAADHKD
jgi:hypothetical protein